MDKKILAGIVIIIILTSIGAYLALTPNYKEIEMSGYSFEVPDSNAEVKNNTINYNTYLDTENNLNIKTWSCKDINDINGTANASIDMGIQLGENMGTNTTYNNITLYNKSGTYTYYEVDTSNACIILITSKNLNTIEHILETMKKPAVNLNNPFNMTSTGLNISNTTDDTTSNTQTTTKTTTKKTSRTEDNDVIHVDANPEANGEYKSVGEGIYRNRKTGKVYAEDGRGNLVRSPELDHYPGLAE